VQRSFSSLAAFGAALLLAARGEARADEGMWTFDAPPIDRIAAATGARLDAAWLDAARASAVRLTNGCSGGIVSGQGLVMTNAHCVADCVQTLSGGGEDAYLTDARDREERCAGLQAEALLTITDVTDQVRASVQGKDGEAYVRAREGALALAELAACGQDRTLRCQAVSFFRGGQYKVYKYRRYNDVRLVFAPEAAVAAFGGDPDNFNFPRFAFDVAFLRLYVDEAPAATPVFLPWRSTPPAEGEASFVVGNPGSTERQLTVAQLETQRDLVQPLAQAQRLELRGRLLQFRADDPDRARGAAQALAWVENGVKIGRGRMALLNDRAFMAGKRAEEDALKARVAADPALAATAGVAWDRIADAQDAARDLYPAYRQLENGPGGSDLFYDARLLVRAALERDKPDAERLPEYGDARLPRIERRLLDAPPRDLALERIYLEHWLLKTREALGVDDPRVKALLGGDSPENLARALAETRLVDPAFRAELWAGGRAAVEASDDPLVAFVLRIDGMARAARAAYEAKVSGPVDAAAEAIAGARLALLGDQIYPDATFTLRLSYGRVAGWRERGRAVEPFTTFAGFYARASGAPPFVAPPRWLEARKALAPDTPFDFVTTNDIVGGNSGSPVLDRRGRVMGAIFDGNSHAIGGAYGYDATANRAVALTTAAIGEALSKVYGRAGLADELMGR